MRTTLPSTIQSATVPISAILLHTEDWPCVGRAHTTLFPARFIDDTLSIYRKYYSDTLRKLSCKPKFHGLRRWVTLSLIGLNAIKLQTASIIPCVSRLALNRLCYSKAITKYQAVQKGCVVKGVNSST
ncbi:hypothetical protein GGP41_008027 [Bipolaris sorokiniana]|uniref:Uncharacterized protein n=1 Tax=Cochliobolus sativus TaxID=45130 RepID=A0A8H5ZP45_COCSA|nr:hypothetical protein GGP41_008027 [Bipolaris sorokiniana]